MRGRRRAFVILIAALALIVPTAVAAGQEAQSAAVAEITLMHTNDFHGRLQPDSAGRGGAAYIADVVNDTRAELGEDNVVLLDAGDEFFAAPAISQLLMGESTIDVFNAMGYELAVFGNHEFDKGQEILAERVAQSTYPWLGANVVLEGTDWDLPPWAEPYVILEVGEPGNEARLGVIGVSTEETPEVTLLGVTDGLVFKDITETIEHYYEEVMAQADALIVVAHMGTQDSGPYAGLVTVAQNLIDDGMPVDLMVGGHQHQVISTPVYVGDTAIVAAGYYGRYLGQIDVAIDTASKHLTVESYTLHTITAQATIESLLGDVESAYEDGTIKSRGAYMSLRNSLLAAQQAVLDGKPDLAIKKLELFMQLLDAHTPKGIDPAVAAALGGDAQWALDNTDFDIAARVAYWAEVVAPIVEEPVGATTVDLVRDYNNESIMGDIVTDSMLWSADLYDDGELNGTVDVAFTNAGGLRADIVIPDGAPLPYTVTWGDTFDVLPFGNTLYMMDLTGAQIEDLLNQSASLYKGILQTSGAMYYWYNDTGDASPTAWGAYGIEIGGEPLDRDMVYRVVTNDFLAGGQDGFVTFADGTNRWNTYYDMQQGFVEYIGMLEVIDAEDVPMDRIIRLDQVVTMLHTNDSHGNWPAGTYSGRPNGYALLASLIKAERSHNPEALLLDAGDTFQGNSFAYFFKDRSDNPIAGGMNLLGFDAITVGNHEFNFGPTTYATMLGSLDFPILGKANLIDDGSYGFVNDHMLDSINLDVSGVDVTIFGLTNPRVYRYELPTNIPGLTFLPALDVAETLVPQLIADEDPDLLVGLTHVGYAPYGDEIDSDVLIAEGTPGVDVLIGGHSHTKLDPAVMVTSDLNPEGTLVAQAERYALNLGVVNVGFIDGDIVLREGHLIPAAEATPDAETTAFLAPYISEIDAYNATVIGSTEVPIDALNAYTQETNGANLQADAAIFELESQAVDVDIHLSGAMSNRLVADGATAATPVTLTKGDMFTLMPYENSLVVFEMTGVEIKEVLERGFRNYWYYKYDPAHGGYSYYTTCMLTTDAGNVITYNDPGAGTPPDGDNVLSLSIDGAPVDLTDDVTTYRVSTVNYIAAGSCNFNDAGETIWPLDQIVADTQLYVRDSVIDYVAAQPGPIAPAIEGRLVFTTP